MKLLFAEDEMELSHTVCAILRHRGNGVDPAYDGKETLRRAYTDSYDRMVMGMMIPRQDDISVVRALRTEGDRTPATILTAKTRLEDKITGLDAGADDYLTKPFAMRELLARIRNMARRSGYQEECIQADNVTPDMREQELKALSPIRISSKEVRLVELFVRNPDKLLGGEELFRQVWGEDEENSDEQLFLCISYPRQKLGAIQADLLIRRKRGGSFVLR